MAVVYSTDLIAILDRNIETMIAISSKLNSDDLKNKGLFLMSTTYFEATLRDLMYKILINHPDKLKKDNFTINKQVLCDYGDTRDSYILSYIIENELFNLFKGNVKDQLLYVVEIVSNIKVSSISNKPKHQDTIEIINKCSDVSIYRNCLIHNAGVKSKDFNERIQFYKYPDANVNILFSKELIGKFIGDYLDFFKLLKEKIQKNIDFKQKTRVEQLRQLWAECFNSKLLNFDDYWEIDEERDLVINIKYTKYEDSLSSGERVYLSIWRHQFYDSVKTEEFLIVSVDIDKIYRIYKVLDEVKFYYMHQQARNYS